MDQTDFAYRFVVDVWRFYRDCSKRIPELGKEDLDLFSAGFHGWLKRLRLIYPGDTETEILKVVANRIMREFSDALDATEGVQPGSS